MKKGDHLFGAQNQWSLTPLIIVVFSLLLFAISPAKATTVTITTTGAGTWTVPANVISVTVQVWGGGGAGGGNTTNADGGGGGGGGGYSLGTVAVTPGNLLNIFVGAGGAGVAGGTGNGGGDTYFMNAATVMARGGVGGAPPVAGAGGLPGAGGNSASGVGTTKWSGGTGGTGRNHNTGTGGGGGSSAGTAANGNNGGNGGSTPGAGGTAPAGGGVGGNGGAAGANGLAPASGNGGGGGGSGDTGTRTGGNGAGGKIIITYKTNQTITFGAQAAQTYAPAGTFAISPLATTTSGLAITYTSTTLGVCTIAVTTVTIVTAGTCTIAANQAGDADWNPAPQVTQDITINKANQATLTVTAPTSVTYGSTGTLTSSGGSGTGAVTFSVGASTGCNITAGTTLNVSDASGTCNVTATKAADNNYNATTSASFPVTLNQANQATLTVTAPTSVTYGSTGTLTSSGGSGTGTVTFDVGVSTGCNITAGTTLNVSDASGTCNVTATKAADNNYNATTSASFAVTLNKASQTISFGPAPTVVVGGTGTVSATGGASGNPVTFTSTTPAVCSATGTNGATITGITAGTCTIAADQAGNANYNAAPQVTQTFAVGQSPPTATTNAASGVASANGAAWSATLNGTVSSNGASTTVYFAYGTTIAYLGGTITATQPLPLAAGAVGVAVSASIDGLACNTTFHYRVVATNSEGLTNGLDSTFSTGSCLPPFPATACAATRYGTDLGCTANDVNITGITLAPSSISSCVSGNTVSLDLDLTVNFAVPDRWDVGIFIANDGNLPTLLPANGGASSCSVAVLPIVPETGSYTFPDLDGAPQGTADTCGDGNGSIDDSAFPGGTVPLGDGVKRMTGVTMPCYASPASGGKLFVPFAVSWDNQKSPTGSLCTSNLYPVPNTTSKCNAPASTVSIAVVVLPVITKTNGGTEINPGANTTYTVTIFNNSGGTLLDMVFTDPAVTNLTVNSVSCAAASGATCPAMTSAAMIAAMQPPPSGAGAGIPIPSTSLPNNSTLTFTINATVSPGAGIGSTITNTATATLTGGGNTSVSDVDTVVLAPSAAMSFSPATITEGATSVLTITLTNPTASPVTGAAFTDTYPSGVVNAGSAVTTCPDGTATTPTSGSLELSGGTIPANGSCTVTVNVTSATACSAPCYVNSTGTVTTTSSGTISAASATLTVNVAVFGAFNACDDLTDPNALCTNTTTSTNSRISTKIAGSPFTLDLVALNSDGSWNSSYSNDVIVELLDASDNSGTPVTPGCLSSWTVIATLGSNPSFASSNGQITTATSFTVLEAYRDVRVRVSNNGGATRVGCSTDFFAIRPYAFTLATSANADTSSGSNATAPPTFVAASSTFTVTVTPVNALGNAITNYTGIPKVDISRLFGTSTLGTLATAPSATTPPTFQTTATGTFTYTEVGYLKFDERSIYDDTWTSLDASDCTSDFSNTLVGVKYGCKFGNTSPGGTTNVIWAGRFKPDHFETVVTGPMTCSGLTFATACPVVSDYLVYSGQPFTTMVTAYRSGGTGATGVTMNYAGSFAKTVTLTAWDTLGGATQNPPAGGGALTFNTITPASFTAGVATTTTPVYTFTATPTAPTNIYIRADDTDAVSSLRSPSSSSVEGGLKVVSGRLHLLNAYGSELLPIRVPVRVEYWSEETAGIFRWQVNTADSITSLDAVNVARDSAIVPTFVSSSQTTAVSSLLVNSGQATMILTQTGCPSTCPVGRFDLAFNLGATGTDASCNSAPQAAAASNQPWLRFGWCVGSHDPNARIKFGSPKAPYIYLRERY